MCVIALVNAGVDISEETLKKCNHHNRDGIGYMFALDGKIKIRRFLGYKEFLKKFLPEYAALKSSVDFVLHFRIATAGGVNLENCHPFSIGSEHAFVHNGIISGWGDKTHSDTNQFRSEMLLPLVQKDPKFLVNDELWLLMEMALGTHNKFVVLRNDGAYRIVNEQAGKWQDKIWFSNLLWDYTPYVAPKYVSPKDSYWTRNTGKYHAEECKYCFRPTICEDKVCYSCRHLYGETFETPKALPPVNNIPGDRIP